MNDYFSRGEVSPVDRVSTRNPVVPVVPTTQVGEQNDIVIPPAAADKPVDTAEADGGVSNEEHLASAAEYAKVHAKIASIMAGVRSSAPAVVTTDDAAAAVSSMLPARIVIVPLPPASKDMVERAEEVAQEIAQRAAQSVAAQAHVK